MQESETPTDAFGDEMVFVDSYGGYLPRSENIPTARTRFNGIAGITHNGDIYCVDCALDMGVVGMTDDGLRPYVDGHYTTFREAPRTGVALPSYESMTQPHCGCHSGCVNALSGSEHPYNNDCAVGIGIESKPIEH